MIRKLSTYKRINDMPHINETIVSSIIKYCLTLMTNKEKKFDIWHVGITTTDEIKGDNHKSWPCASHLEAVQTKQYLITEKTMINDDIQISGDETIIYIYRD